MSTATCNATINWCPPIHHTLTPASDPSLVTLPKGFSVLILGSSRGIGKATAIAYAKAGASTIILTGRDILTLEVARKEVTDAADVAKKVGDATVEISIVDVCSDADLKRLARSAGEWCGDAGLDVLILNAGVATKPLASTGDWPCGIHELDIPDFTHTFRVNFFAGVGALQCLLPLVQLSRMRTVVWVTSSSIHHVDPGKMAMGYSLSKFAAARFVEYVAVAHGDVVVVGIQPGSCMTDMGRWDLPKGKGWESILIDDVGLGGGLCVWLTKERREWLSGRWVDARWDVDELERRKDEIVKRDMLKFRMTE